MAQRFGGILPAQPLAPAPRPGPTAQANPVGGAQQIAPVNISIQTVKTKQKSATEQSYRSARERGEFFKAASGGTVKLNGSGKYLLKNPTYGYYTSGLVGTQEEVRDREQEYGINPPGQLLVDARGATELYDAYVTAEMMAKDEYLRTRDALPFSWEELHIILPEINKAKIVEARLSKRGSGRVSGGRTNTASILVRSIVSSGKNVAYINLNKYDAATDTGAKEALRIPTRGTVPTQGNLPGTRITLYVSGGYNVDEANAKITAFRDLHSGGR